LYDIRTPYTVATSRSDAVVSTTVGLRLIAVITGFVALLTFTQIRPSIRVAAAGSSAMIPAAVGLDLVAVITLFALFNLSIAAVLQRAAVRTSICIDLIAVIASLETRLARVQVSSHHSVTAARQSTLA
jgi:hypothetical protein